MPAPKQRRLDQDDSQSDHELGWLQDDSDNSDGAYDYPSGLMDEAKTLEWDSPTKATRTYQQPLTRRTRPQKNDGRKAQVIPDVIRDSNPHVPQDGLAGPSFSWDFDAVDDAVVDVDIPLQVQSPAPSVDNLTDAKINRYADAVDSFSAGFFHIEGPIFVVEGWDILKEHTTAHWYHLQYLTIQNEIHVACTCPAGLQNECIHQVFFKTYDLVPQIQGVDVESSPSKQTPATVFIRQRLLNSEEFVTMFSVKSLSSSALKGRAIVTHTGATATSGLWKCLKDPGLPCVHITLAKRALLEMLGLDGEEVDNEAGWIPAQSLVSLAHRQPVSHLPVLPPLAALLKTDVQIYPRPPPYRDSIPPLFKLSTTSSCPCPTGRTFWNPAASHIERSCQIYTLFSIVPATLQLQPCTTCGPSRRRFVGADLREFGIFNYNNSILVSHELLDEYTMSYTTSETPFTAYVAIVAQRYALLGATFMGIDLFRSVWFSYVTLQAFNDDMQCIRCGPTPETTIWDGITLAFGKKHLSTSLSPPTQLSSQSARRTHVKAFPRPQFFSNKDIRRKLRAVVEKGVGNNSGSLSDDEGGEDAIEDSESQVTNAYLQQVDSVQEELKTECLELASLFLEHFGTVAISKKRSKSSLAVYQNFFCQIGAEESVLQMVNGTALQHINTFLANPERSNLSLLVGVPALYKLLEAQLTFEHLIPIVAWMARRAAGTLAVLTVEPPLQLSNLAVDENADWKSTGCLYSLPQIRHRPAYPNLKSDQKIEGSSKRGDRCGKYYSQYGKQKLTGGIMVVWCTHSVCYGFHCIPESEGRNDVFSAMVTRWPVAPKHVVYDFACALGPYCMLREPDFFNSTLFTIDHFHTAGHTKCSPAAFLSEYSNVDPRLVHINSSAGECGNSGLRRIRKSVSYMGQQRAIIYTKVFLSVWNRIRLRKMQ